MGSVAVVTDTTHYLPRELVDANDLHLVSLYVHWDGRDDRESDLPDFDTYYEHLRTASALPTRGTAIASQATSYARTNASASSACASRTAISGCI